MRFTLGKYIFDTVVAVLQNAITGEPEAQKSIGGAAFVTPPIPASMETSARLGLPSDSTSANRVYNGLIVTDSDLGYNVRYKGDGTTNVAADWEESQPEVVSRSVQVVDGPLATIIVSSGGYTYIAESVPGTAATAASWRCQKIDEATGSTTWANGDGNFDNIPGAAGAGLSALTYS